MKKLTVFLAMAAVAVIALSCTKDKAPVKMKTISVELGCPQIVAQGDDLDSKTTLSGTSILWKTDDVNIVAITDGETIGENWYTLKAEKTDMAVATKVFTGTIPENENVLCYYYRRNKDAANCTLSKNEKEPYTIRNNHAQTQTCGDNTFNTMYNDAIAKAGDGAVFKSILGYFKWTNTSNADIKKVKVETITDGEYFAGYYRCNYSGSDPVTTVFTGSSKYNYVENTVNTTTINPDMDHYIIVFPGEYHGLKVTITLTDGTSFAIKSTKTFTVERGKYIDLGVLPSKPIDKTTTSNIDFDNVGSEAVGDSGLGMDWN